MYIFKSYIQFWQNISMNKTLIKIALIVLDKPNQLPGHITGALNYGWSKEEIVELITQMLFYGGYPTAVNSLAAAAKTFEEYDKRH